MLPNTFIIGVQKSGTTALHHLLSEHPDVFFPKAPQEIHFFDVEKNFKKGIEWYESLFRDWSGQKVIAQTSPLYFFEPHVPARIRQLAPDGRLIVILRNPVDRAYSHYWHAVKHGVEKLPFHAALEQESQRLLEGFQNRRNFSYLSRGEYSTQFERFLVHFPREQILPLRFDDLISDVDELCARCARFLSISPAGFVQERGAGKIRNAARMPRSRLLQSIARGVGKLAPAAGQLIARRNLKAIQYPPMSVETRRGLQDRFRTEILRTSELTGLDLKAWLD
jgi:hypothetical protein